MMQNLLDVKGIGQKTALKLNEIGIYKAKRKMEIATEGLFESKKQVSISKRP